jgi:hypothetical protein
MSLLSNILSPKVNICCPIKNGKKLNFWYKKSFKKFDDSPQDN